MVVMRAINSVDIIKSKKTGVGFTGEWLDSFGDPLLRGLWFVYGGSGSGKTTFMMQLAKYLSKFCGVFYDSLEMPIVCNGRKRFVPPALSIAAERVGLGADSGRVNFGTEYIDDLHVRLDRRNAPGAIIIDSCNYLRKERNTKQYITMPDYMTLMECYPDTLFVVIGHAKGSSPKGSLGIDMKFHADIKIYTYGFQAYVTTRYEADGVGGKPFIIWAEGAEKFNL